MADDQPCAALAAVDRALEVVRVLSVLLAGKVLGGEQPLNLMPSLGRRQRLMLAGVEDPSVAR